MYDVIIIGKGPAGISAALYTVRANLKTLVIGTNESVLRKASKIENYFGFSEPISGEHLLAESERQLLRLGSEIVRDEVVAISQQEHFEVMTANNVYHSKTLLLATGQPQKKFKLKNLEGFEGRGVSYCTTCDGFFYKNLKVGIVGFRDFAVHEASELEMFTKDITIFTNGNKLELTEVFQKKSQGFRVIETPIESIDGNEFLEKINFIDGTSENISGIFIAFDSASSTDFARKLGLVVNGSSVVVDRNQRTNIEGVYAAGDCTGGFKQIATAVGQGALSAKNLIEYLRSNKK